MCELLCLCIHQGTQGACSCKFSQRTTAKCLGFRSDCTFYAGRDMHVGQRLLEGYWDGGGGVVVGKGGSGKSIP